MDQEKKKEAEEDPKKPSSAKKIEKSQLLFGEYFATSEILKQQTQLLSETITNMLNSISIKQYEPLAKTIEVLEESTKASMRILTDSIKIPIISPELIKIMQELSQSQAETQENFRYMMRYSDANIENIKTGLNGTIHAQNAYIELLERTLEEKDERIKQLEQIIDDTKKKKPDSSIV